MNADSMAVMIRTWSEQYRCWGIRATAFGGWPFPGIPRVGETVEWPDVPGKCRRYRVLDVVWTIGPRGRWGSAVTLRCEELAPEPDAGGGNGEERA